MLNTRDTLNAILDYPETPVESAAEGPLAGLTLAVKDIFDVAGYPTGGGNPAKLAESPIVTRSAPAIQALLDAGAQFVGKTQTDELTYSMIGSNAHFQPPVNPAARERFTGGSSSGSAAAVAGGLADIAVGSDTNGSIRAPASFCGLIGLRTTHGRISLEGALPLSPSFDTLGWFARGMATYARVGEVLLGKDAGTTGLTRPVRIGELEALLFGERERGEYERMLGRVLGQFDRKAGFMALPGWPEELFDCFKEIQAYEAWRVHGPFLKGGDRRLGPGIKERFAYARTVSEEAVEKARERRRLFRDEFGALFEDDMVVVMPTQPTVAPLKSATLEELNTYRAMALTLTSIAGLLGLPQITMPLGEVHGAPFGISLMGPAGSDRRLISLASRIMAA